MRRRQRGFNLIELLVVMGLLAILSVATEWILISASRSSTYAIDKSQATRDAYEVSLRLLSPLEESTSLSLTIHTTGATASDGSQEVDAMSFLCARDASGVLVTDTTAGRPSWQNYRVYYRSSSNNLVEAAPLPFSGTNIQALTSDVLLTRLNTSGRTLMTGVNHWSATLTNDVLQLAIATNTTGSLSQAQSWTLTRSIHVTN